MFEDLIVEKQEVDEWKICPSCGAGKDIEVYPRVRTFATLLLYMHCPKNKRKEMNKKIKDSLADQFCPFCNNKHIEPTDGIFMLGNYVQRIICLVCSAEWTITYDCKLNIIGVTT
jgi:hypothetical protein